MKSHQQVAAHDGVYTEEKAALWPPFWPIPNRNLFCFCFQGADIFAAKINIEVQRATEGAIAAIERNGGTITTSFYDPLSLGNWGMILIEPYNVRFLVCVSYILEKKWFSESVLICTGILIKPVSFFMRGQPIPKRMLPGENMVPYYVSAENRGYLAGPEEIQQARRALAQKYGYVLPDISKDELYHMLAMRKDVRQIFFGLSPGWVVNMSEKKILKPTDEKLLKYYSS